MARSVLVKRVPLSGAPGRLGGSEAVLRSLSANRLRPFFGPSSALAGPSRPYGPGLVFAADEAIEDLTGCEALRVLSVELTLRSAEKALGLGHRPAAITAGAKVTGG